MESRVAVMGIVIENTQSIGALNALLHDWAPYIIGRMGLPYPKRGIHVISLALDAPQDRINALSGQVGKLPGISVKTAYSGVSFND